MFSIEIEVTDSLIETRYKHVHHADSLRFLETARVELLKQLGCPLDSYLQRDLFLVISRVAVEYKREVRAGIVKATCERLMVNDKIVQISQKLFNEKGKLAVEANVESQFLSRKTGRAVEVPEDFLQAVRNFNSMT